MPRVLGLAALLMAWAAAAAADNPLATYRTLSAPDCAPPSNVLTDYEERPVVGTYLRVQHIGDPGTEELERQVANAITWDAGPLTGLSLPPDSQLGYLDVPGRSVFQLRCRDAGFYIDSATFSHASPLFGEGPNITVGRDFTPGLPAFQGGASLLLEADVRVPTVRPQYPPVVNGAAQVHLMIYLHDTTTNTAIAQLVALLDDRPPGVRGSGVESLGNDGFVAFASSPLATFDATGSPVRFVTVGPGSAVMQYVDGWSEARHFAALITPANFSALLLSLREQGAAISPRPSDYVVTLFGLLGEIIVGTAHENEVALGASVSNLALRELPPLPPRAGPGFGIAH